MNLIPVTRAPNLPAQKRLSRCAPPLTMIAFPKRFETWIKRASLGVGCASFAFAANASPEQPNILVIMADDLGYETIGAYGGLTFSTPELDRMASEGVRFSHTYTSPVCTPSRM